VVEKTADKPEVSLVTPAYNEEHISYQSENLQAREPTISIIIPAYNEEKRVGQTLQKLLGYLSENFHEPYEILVVMDGCTDDTPSMVNQIARENGNIISVYFPKRLGKGGALIEAFKRAKSDILLFTDADLSIPPGDLHKIADFAKRYDLVIGSRYTRGSKVLAREPLIRLLLSRCFNLVSKMFFWRLKRISDTQCGAKAIRKRVFQKIQGDLFITGFAFDVNLIYSALRHGFRVKETGVTWLHKESGSKISGKLLKLILAMFFSTVKLRIYYSRFRAILDKKLMETLSTFVWKLTT